MKKWLLGLLSLSLILTGCSGNNYPDPDDVKPTDTTIKEDDKTTDEEKGNETPDDEKTDDEKTNDEELSDMPHYRVPSNKISYDVNDYVRDKDLEVFTYGLIVNELESCYDVFPCYVELSTCDLVYGIGFTNFDECYGNDDDSDVYFTAGFFSYCDELTISDEEFNTGLLLYNLDFEAEDTSFVWKYKSLPFKEHCVVFGKYLVYGINENNQIFFEEQPFSREICDLSLGSLYSYDESRYLYDDGFGNFVNVTGKSISEDIDYSSIKKQLEDYIKQQDLNFVQIDSQTTLNTAREAIESYLLSEQQETFLGYPVETLIEASKEVETKDVFRITNEGLAVVDVLPPPEPEPSAITKWLVGVGCSILTIVGVVGSVVFMEFPVFSSLSSALSGFAISMFMQVVVENHTLENVDWTRVAIAVAAGAVSGFVGPYLRAFAGANKLLYYVTDVVVDGVIGGLTKTTEALVDGASFGDAAKRFGFGFLEGAVLSLGFKLAGEALSALGDVAKKVADKLSPNINKVISKLVAPFKKIGNAIGDGLDKLKSKADEIPFLHSKYIASSLNASYNLTLAGNPAEKKSFNALSKDGIKNLDGEDIDKNQLKQIFAAAKNGDEIGEYIINGEVVKIVKLNGVAGIYFDSASYQSVELPNGLTTNRNINFNEAADLFRNKWILEPDQVPEKISKYLSDLYPGEDITDVLKSLSKSRLVDIFGECGYVLHENIDLYTVTLVAKELHNKSRGYNGVSHFGGIALAKYIKNNFGKNSLADFISAAIASGGAA